MFGMTEAEEVAESLYRLESGALRSRDRTQLLCEARAVRDWLAVCVLRCSPQEVGRFYRRDPSSIRTASRKVQRARAGTALERARETARGELRRVLAASGYLLVSRETRDEKDAV